jgi:hypothetical protein
MGIPAICPDIDILLHGLAIPVVNNFLKAGKYAFDLCQVLFRNLFPFGPKRRFEFCPELSKLLLVHFMSSAKKTIAHFVAKSLMRCLSEPGAIGFSTSAALLRKHICPAVASLGMRARQAWSESSKEPEAARNGAFVRPVTGAAGILVFRDALPLNGGN